MMMRNIDKLSKLLEAYKEAFETNKEIGRAYMHEDVETMLRVITALTKAAKNEYDECSDELIKRNKAIAKKRIEEEAKAGLYDAYN
jgi:hypothetical protein